MCLNPGDILRDRYKIIGNLGQGGFAKTYRASDLEKSGNPLCVVKEIKLPSSTEPLILQQANQQFQKEVEALKLLGQDSRIPEYYDSFQDQEKGKFYLIQEYIEGHPLNQELTTGTQWNEEKTVGLLREILEILQFVHQKNVIHRDLKPSNLIRRKSDGKIVLIDFGAVKEISTLEITESGETRTRTIYTPGYTSPEQMHGRPQFCSDIYSVGIIGIQAITGLRPASDLLTHSQGDIVWRYSTPGQPMVQISQQLETILNKMVSYYFANRYQSAAEVLQDLREAKLSRRESLKVWHSPPPKRQGLSGPSVKWLLLGLVGVIAGGAIAIFLRTIIPKTCPLIQGDALSCGEEILIKTSSPRSKQRGVEEFIKSNYQSAFNLFKKGWNEEYSIDPETLIYMNNAFLKAKNADYYTIAVAVPILKNQSGSVINADSAKELLRGVAQAQTEVNLGVIPANERNQNFPDQSFLEAKAINGKGLRVIIADDANLKEEAIKRAESLVKQPDILGVVGHYASEITLSTVDIYDQNNLVLLSPGSTTEELTEKPRKVFFRTSYSSQSTAQTLAKYLRSVGKNQATVLYNPGSSSGSYFTRAFTSQFQDDKKAKIVRIRNFDLSKNEFNVQTALNEIEQLGETALVLSPDGQITNSLNNAIATIKANRDRNWIAGIWVLYKWRTLEAVSQLKSFKKLILSVPWHPLNSVNKQFPQQAQKLWGGKVNTDTALAYDATKALIKAMEMQQKPSREGMQKMLSSPDFSADGATGTIQFESPKNGNRKNPPSDLVHIVKCKKEQFGVVFVPVKYPTAEAAGLKCE